MYMQVLYTYVPVVDRLGQNGCLPHLLLCASRQVLFLVFATVLSCSAATATCLLPFDCNYIVAAHRHFLLARGL